ncbi:MAG: hypothetical protein ACREQA_17885 [Candidatus Binatia bacterium]
MAGQILVPLKKDDQFEEILPYLEKIAQSGMRVVFLIHYPLTGGFDRLRYHGVTGEPVEEATFTANQIAEREFSEEEKERQHRIFLAQEALREKGVEIIVDVYTGSLRRVIEDYKASGDVHWIMMRPRRGNPIMRLLGWRDPFFGMLKRSSFCPVLLLHPGITA